MFTTIITNLKYKAAIFISVWLCIIMSNMRLQFRLNCISRDHTKWLYCRFDTLDSLCFYRFFFSPPNHKELFKDHPKVIYNALSFEEFSSVGIYILQMKCTESWFNGEGGRCDETSPGHFVHLISSPHNGYVIFLTRNQSPEDLRDAIRPLIRWMGNSGSWSFWEFLTWVVKKEIIQSSHCGSAVKPNMVSMRTWVWSLALLSGLGIVTSYGVGCRYGLDPALPWLWLGQQLQLWFIL